MRKGEHTEPTDDEPLLERDAPRGFDGEIDGDAQERIREAVVGGRFGGEDESEVARDVLSGELATYMRVDVRAFKRPEGTYTLYAPTIAADMIGSVGVRQAAMTSEETKLSGGNKRNMTPVRVAYGELEG